MRFFGCATIKESFAFIGSSIRNSGRQRMEEIIFTKVSELEAVHENEHKDFEYLKYELLPKRKDGKSRISIYEVPPKKSAYPYHFHTKNEESFYILSGTGLLRTPGGERTVTAGDFIYFPANEKGAHILSNPSETEKLVYLDCDTCNEIDVAFYPDSGKIGIWGMGIDQMYKIKDQVDYYES